MQGTSLPRPLGTLLFHEGPAKVLLPLTSPTFQVKLITLNPSVVVYQSPYALCYNSQ